MIPWFSRKPCRTSFPRRTARPTLELLEQRVVPTLNSGPLTVNSTNETDSNPATASASNDNVSMAVVAWTQSTASGDTDIMASKASPPSTIGGALNVPSTAADEDNADVAINGDGDIVVVWTSTMNGNSDVEYAFFPAGNTTPSVTGSVANTTLQEINPRVGMNKNGAFVVSYEVSNEPGTNGSSQTVLSKNVRAKLYDGNGNENAMIQVAVSSSVDEFNPRIDMSPGGKFSISYFQSDPNEPTINQKVYVANYSINSSSTKASKSSSFKIANAPSGGQIVDQDVAVDKNGNALVVLLNQDSSATQTFSGRRVNGGVLKSSFNPQMASFDPGTAFSIAMNQNNKDFAVTFQFTSGDGPHAFVQEFFSNGDAQQTNAGVPVAFQLDSVDGAAVDTSSSAISIDANNNYFVAYVTESNSDDLDAQFGTLA